jgi:aryl-alcohol dehydrogenase-like predicted oxidoreductase
MERMRESVCGEMRTSVLGFGCGSVLGRVGRGASLRAMETAWDAGVRLFDTARSYGFGEAEAVLGEFLRGKRDEAVIATKYGIAPQRQSAVKRVAVPVARAVMRVPGVRGILRGGGSREVTHGQFSVAGLRESVETSLRALQTDRVDVLFLHEATSEVLQQHELMNELDALVRAGKALRAGLYASADVVAEGMERGPATLTAMQFGGDAFDPVAASVMGRNPRGMFLIANHPFGSEERVARIQAVMAAMSADESVPAEIREKLRGADWQAVLEAVLGVILEGTETHALVFSMMRADHLKANVRAVESCRFTAAELALMRQRLLDSALVTHGAL